MRCFACLLLFALPGLPQPVQSYNVSPGRLLVAARSLPDPNFSESVVLLVRKDGQSVMGLVVNNRTNVPVSRALQGIKEAEGRKDLVYLGGPVARSGIVALVRTRTRPEPADRVTGDVYLVTDKAALEKLLAARIEASAFRLYLGYSGWTPAQLDAELDLGAWAVFPPDLDAVFDPNPESVWPRLIRKTEERIASPAPLSPARLIARSIPPPR